MLSRRYRLHSTRALARVRRSRLVYRGPLLMLRVVHRGDTDLPRVAVIVSRRVSKRAVDRHRVARWIREGVRTELPGMVRGVDLLFSASVAHLQYSFTACADEIQHLLARARLRP